MNKRAIPQHQHLCGVDLIIFLVSSGVLNCFLQHRDTNDQHEWTNIGHRMNWRKLEKRQDGNDKEIKVRYPLELLIETLLV